MNRDFKEEYEDYIESQTPDLWSRIEPNLKEKLLDEKAPDEKAPDGSGEVSRGKRRRTSFYKAMIPVAACLCLLLAGIGAMGLHRGAKNETAYDAGAAEAPQEYEDMEAVTEEAADEEAVETEEIVEEAPKEDPKEAAEELLSDGVEAWESAADEEDSAVNGQESAAAVEEQESDAVNGRNEAEALVRLEKAVLTRIGVVSEAMREKGYSYVYTFRLTDDSSILVYLTEVKCNDLKEQGVEIERQSAYALSVYPLDKEETADSAEAEYILQKIEKLP